MTTKVSHMRLVEVDKHDLVLNVLSKELSKEVVGAYQEMFPFLPDCAIEVDAGCIPLDDDGKTKLRLEITLTTDNDFIECCVGASEGNCLLPLPEDKGTNRA